MSNAYIAAANMFRDNQLYNVYISGHGPSHQEWSSGGGLSSINFLVAKKDPLSVDVQAADDKSMSPVDQVCTVHQNTISDYGSARFSTRAKIRSCQCHAIKWVAVTLIRCTFSPSTASTSSRATSVPSR
jgi:hypothetical protein